MEDSSRFRMRNLLSVHLPVRCMESIAIVVISVGDGVYQVDVSKGHAFVICKHLMRYIRE
jgi:hypothetical protein